MRQSLMSTPIYKIFDVDGKDNYVNANREYYLYWGLGPAGSSDWTGYCAAVRIGYLLKEEDHVHTCDYRIADNFRFGCSQFFTWSGSSAKQSCAGRRSGSHWKSCDRHGFDHN